MKPAIGHLKGRQKRIVCGFDPDEFDRIAGADIPGETSMVGRIRVLAEWGLEALETQGERK